MTRGGESTDEERGGDLKVEGASEYAGNASYGTCETSFVKDREGEQNAT